MKTKANNTGTLSHDARLQLQLPLGLAWSMSSANRKPWRYAFVSAPRRGWLTRIGGSISKVIHPDGVVAGQSLVIQAKPSPGDAIKTGIIYYYRRAVLVLGIAGMAMYEYSTMLMMLAQPSSVLGSFGPSDGRGTRPEPVA
ncbi:hypothetical protein M431DRAFT_546567 [Trichoderma harzianum CBS 226.95]|uniref:Uncharacterized protein n=1 Tax=Trichoderma harzianum CBS 226.95 TaxID=983964 RepID=A0A2T3ZUM5_TRIHA|nr:hypothetical protein M431DRAFT_546567 [Trichoderma harzianum CBS 226.95]PTB48516.1 hypothetical protein M431DRAFT_546567 [Trichoderma harzianum CBS 226.95]